MHRTSYASGMRVVKQHALIGPIKAHSLPVSSTTRVLLFICSFLLLSCDVVAPGTASSPSGDKFCVPLSTSAAGPSLKLAGYSTQTVFVKQIKPFYTIAYIRLTIRYSCINHEWCVRNSGATPVNHGLRAGFASDGCCPVTARSAPYFQGAVLVDILSFYPYSCRTSLLS